jgi:methyl-accepting chemotaxis protein
MQSEMRKTFNILTRAGSLRRRVAFSLAIVRLILVPVIFLCVYYLVKMDSILDRILNVDAPTGTLAQRASIELLEARRVERSFFLLHDPTYLQVHAESLARAKKILSEIHDVESNEQPTTRKVLQHLDLYEQQFATAVSVMEEPGGTPMQRIQEVVQRYEKDLNNHLRRARRDRQPQLVEDLRRRVGSFDDEITSTIQAGDPRLRQVTADLQASSQEVLDILSDLEKRSGARVERGHEQARRLVHSAEWVIGIVSALTLLLSVWISFVLPRRVVKPLVDLKQAVDHAATGNYEVEFPIRGGGELEDLTKSVRNLIAHTRQTSFRRSKVV